MTKNVILILDSCCAFSKGLKRYSETKGIAQVHILDKIEAIEAHPYDYLLIDEADYKAIAYPDRRVYKLITDDSFQSDKPDVINRLSKASDVIAKLNNSCQSKQHDLVKAVLFSMSGGTGKSTIASGICDAAEMHGKKTLYISFSTYIQNGHKDVDLSLIVYYLYKHKSIPETIEASFLERLESSQLTLNGALNAPEDIVHLTPDVLTLFTEWLSSLELNRLLVIEIPWSFSTELQIMLQFATHRLLVTDERHAHEEIMMWQDKYKNLINNDKGFYLLNNRSSEEAVGEMHLCVPKYELSKCKKGMKEWASKYLLTHWIMR